MTGSRSWASRGSRRGRFQALLAAAGSFLLDPSDAVGPHGPIDPQDPRRLRDDGSPDPQVVHGAGPLVAVFGLAGGCGSTVVARAVAAELAARDASGTAAVACESRAGGVPLATKAASRLARALEDLPGGTRALGRLCLLRGADPGSLGDALHGLAPLVIDAGSSSLGGVPACIADRTLIVTTPAIEPTLARVAIECVARVGPEPTLVINRVRYADGLIAVGEGDPGVTRAQIGGPGAAHDYAGPAVALPESRFGAQLALGGREARGGLGRAIAGLVDGWEGGV